MGQTTMTDLSAARPFLQEALEAHLLELDLLWEQREIQIFSKVWTLEDLAAIEARADAHLDAMVLAAPFTHGLARRALASGETGASCAGAMVLLACGEVVAVYRALREANARTVFGLRSALRHGMPSWDEAELRTMAVGSDPLVCACVADVLAFRRRTPLPGVSELIESDDVAVQRLAFAALGRAADPLDESTLEMGLRSEEAEVRFAGLRAAASTGMPRLADRCRALAAQAAPAAAEALEMLGCLANAQDLSLFVEKLSDPALAGAAVRGLGAAGDPSCVPALLEAMTLEALAAAASAAFVRITGAAGLPRRKLEPATPDEVERDFAALEEAIEPDAAREFWQREHRRFDVQQRYQRGRITPSSPDAAFQELPLALRRDVALGARGRGELAFTKLELEARSVLQRG
jgi:uncharacterized protein (TIGR02270 family)